MPSEPSECILDCRALEKLAMLNGEGQTDIVEELIGDFLENTSLKISRLNSPLPEIGVPELRRLAHDIKSAAAMLGLSQLACLCERLEDPSTSPSDFQTLLSRLPERFNAASHYLTTYLKERTLLAADHGSR